MNELKRQEFWDFLTSEKIERPQGVTKKRLEKIKETLLKDDNFWFHVISRFGAENMTAVEFYVEERRHRADQSRGQFWSMVRERILEQVAAK